MATLHQKSQQETYNVLVYFVGSLGDCQPINYLLKSLQGKLKIHVITHSDNFSQFQDCEQLIDNNISLKDNLNFTIHLEKNAYDIGSIINQMASCTYMVETAKQQVKNIQYDMIISTPWTQ